MELWIRSQDREDLVKVNALWIMDNQIWMEVPFYDNHKKLGLTVTSNNHRLAVYKTKERALEVLDKIQQQMENETVETEIRYIDNREYEKIVTRKLNVPKERVVYEMPLE